MFKNSLKSAQFHHLSMDSHTLFGHGATEFFESRKNRILVIATWITACILLSAIMQYHSGNERLRNIVTHFSSFISSPSNVAREELDATPAIISSKNTNGNSDKLRGSIPVELSHLNKANIVPVDSGRGSIKGIVKDAAGQPLSSADILLFREDHWVGATYTSEKGEFLFENIAAGCYKIKIVKEGFAEMAVAEFNVEDITLLREFRLEKLQAVASDANSNAQVLYDVTHSSEVKKTLVNTGKRDMSSFVVLSSGVTQSAGSISGRGSINNGNVYNISGATCVAYAKSWNKSESYSTYNTSNKQLTKSKRFLRKFRYKMHKLARMMRPKKRKRMKKNKQSVQAAVPVPATLNYNTESYAPLIENEYMNPFNDPLSTFSIDVDHASYTNTRRMIMAGQIPPKDAVRIEEFINYFNYNYPQPKDEHPFSINLETASCPWNKDTRIVQIGLKGKDIEKQDLSACNLVFLVDVSGSMQVENKLPLVQKSLKLLVDGLNAKDKISLVTYAGAAGLALDATYCSEKNTIKQAIDNLNAGGSTAGGAGLMLAYKVAKDNFIKDGNNRIILVTDGDFNVGVSSDGEMKDIVESKRKDGIFLTVCGFGMGNYKDSKLETLADYGNGNYYYIDNFKEGSKVFSSGLTGTLFTIAKDVKIQVEFNPKLVKAYRLIGYENRKMEAQDFANDAKDAGELGAGHTVTALYEIIPAGSTAEVPGFITLKYQESKSSMKDFGDEMLTVKLRYKKPDEDVSRLMSQTLMNSTKPYTEAGDNFRYVCGVTMYAMVMRDSKFKSQATYDLAKSLLEGSKLNEGNGYKKELIALIDKASSLSVSK